MSTIELFNANLGTTFQPSAAFMVPADRVVLFFDLDISAPGPVKVEWYAEFSDGVATGPPSSWTWRREVAEEDTGNGVVNMPKVVRTFQDNNGTTGLPVGTHNLDVDLVRRGPVCRIQMRVVAGGAAARVSTPFGTPTT